MERRVYCTKTHPFFDIKDQRSVWNFPGIMPRDNLQICQLDRSVFLKYHYVHAAHRYPAQKLSRSAMKELNEITAPYSNPIISSK